MSGTLQGTGVSPGAGFGPARVMSRAAPPPPADVPHGGDAGAERDRALGALERVAADLQERGERAGGEGGKILQAQALMARDPGLSDEVAELVRAGKSAARAVYEGFGRYRSMLAEAGGYLGARVADLDDVRDRALAVLDGRPVADAVPAGAGPYVLVARDLAPADTALLSPDQVAAFVTEEGGPTSHTSIIARAMGVPAVVACPGATAVAPGTPVLADGSSGLVRLAPSAEEVAAARGAAAARRAALAAVTGPGATADGHAVPLLANIGGPQDLADALEHGAEGVGLYRTEFLFLGRAEAPSAEEQEAAYLEVLEAFPGGQVVVRTLDAGADKPLAFLPPPGEEPNPALGERGIRLLRLHPEVMETQLAALARAASRGTAVLRVMAPMVATAEEAALFAAACREAGLPSAGVMIEVPSAALRAADLAAEADFFSVGTNDLAQYAFAADRQVGALAALHDAWQPALLDLVALAAAGAAGRDRPCGVCGEAAGDPVLACVLVGLGAASLSMSAPALPAVRAALARHSREQCRLAARAARAAASPAQARDAAREHLPGLSELGL
ncbi:phosphoenolpyruvate--protein phosphotransferase [Planomonospora parontospora]|uniref:phosphoenolpyruvate--protein phosphotransferase n=1 Tax=Planomonospora parontospora TaxID=58119 RepID=UPI0016709549|nr:phosphoenolpyruvate--protein phosphotransferase [Planomonospora parontospora]GGL08837.1 phosphoenolpyruvate-protein phosphotransferase [Planomonospora parontospora subsp. antibiotica]GII14482.1 phosphoenolpyruvate-protein phosphotransferase [Planomonospora parontospora subsp. antibiotica]